MAQKTQKHASAQFVAPLLINGLRGRVLKMPAVSKTAKREILFIYGHHSSIERMYSTAQVLSEYGSVVMPDLPGLGGMDSFYAIGQKPTIDTMADYLATFIKMHYKKRRFTLGAMSLGFLIATRMLQKYPEIAQQVDLLMSLVGFTHRDDFHFDARKQRFLALQARVFSTAIPSAFCKYILFRGPSIRTLYAFIGDKHAKTRDADPAERKRRVDFEVVLWRINDPRTWFYTSYAMLTVDLTHTKVAMPVVHVAVDSDQYFDKPKTVAHLKQIYKSVKVYEAQLPNHVPTVISSPEEAKVLIPDAVITMLRRKPSTR